MDEETKKSVERIIEYLIRSEKFDWTEVGQPDDHIYHDVIRLEQWLISEHKPR
jgi:hypothetical protein